jgi:hypothetical protein
MRRSFSQSKEPPASARRTLAFMILPVSKGPFLRLTRWGIHKLTMCEELSTPIIYGFIAILVSGIRAGKKLEGRGRRKRNSSELFL